MSITPLNIHKKPEIKAIKFGDSELNIAAAQYKDSAGETIYVTVGLVYGEGRDTVKDILDNFEFFDSEMSINGCDPTPICAVRFQNYEFIAQNISFSVDGNHENWFSLSVYKNTPIAKALVKNIIATTENHVISFVENYDQRLDLP